MDHAGYRQNTRHVPTRENVQNITLKNSLQRPLSMKMDTLFIVVEIIKSPSSKKNLPTTIDMWFLTIGPDRETIAIQENVKVGANGEYDQNIVIDEIKNYLNCRGAYFYTDMKMVNKINYATFKVACFTYGLLNDDKEWTHAIAKASICAMAQKLRDLFVTVLLFCDVSRPLKLWEENWVRLSEDILDKKRKHYRYPELNLSDEQVRKYCLLEILLNTHGGTRKTFLYKTIIARLRSKQMIVCRRLFRIHCKIRIGITSLLLPVGRTTHSRLVIPLELMENSTCALDRTLQDILGYKNQARRNHIFRGMTVFLGGDFRQILPVIPNAKRPKVAETHCFMNQIREEVDAIRSCIAQTTVVITELQAMEDQDE
nr:ATP-dependent DNA helicase PIF1-like [Tanacetum cinerariifolium]